MQQQSSIFIGIATLFVASALIVDGALGNYYFKHFIHPIIPVSASETASVSQVNQDPKHVSEHVYSDETILEVRDERDGRMATKKFVVPVFRNIGNQNVLDKISQKVSFKDLTGVDMDDELVRSTASGITGVDYQINYDKNNILSLSLFSDFMGAHPSSNAVNYSVNLANGNLLTLPDLFYQNNMDLLIEVLNMKLQDSVTARIYQAKRENPDSHDGECSDRLINEYFQSEKAYDASYGKFTKENVDFIVTPTGVEFVYNFGFPHVMKVCEPGGTVTLAYNQLKDFIRADGLLASEVK